MIPGWGRSPGERNGNPLQYSYLQNPMDRGAWSGLQSMGSHRVRHGRATNTFGVLYSSPRTPSLCDPGLFPSHCACEVPSEGRSLALAGVVLFISLSSHLTWLPPLPLVSLAVQGVRAYTDRRPCLCLSTKPQKPSFLLLKVRE